MTTVAFEKPKWVSTGVKCLDDLLGGGYPKRAVSMFWGSTGVLKTTLGVYLPIIRMFNLEDEHQAYLIIDTEGGVDPDRLTQMAVANKIDPDVLLPRVHIYEPTLFREQQVILEKKIMGGRCRIYNAECDVLDCAKAKDDDGYHYHDFESEIVKNEWNPYLVSLDSVSWLGVQEMMKVPRRFRPVATGDYVNDIGVQVGTLRRIAVKFDCVATCTTWDVSSFGQSMGGKGEFPFLGGRNLAFIAKQNVFLAVPDFSEAENLPDEWRDIRMVMLWKHRAMPRLRQVFVKVCDEGIVDPAVERESA